MPHCPGELLPWGDLADEAFEPWFQSVLSSLGPKAPPSPPTPPAAPELNLPISPAVSGAVTGACLLVLLVFAYRAWRDWRRGQAQATGVGPPIVQGTLVDGEALPPPPLHKGTQQAKAITPPPKSRKGKRPTPEDAAISGVKV